MREQQSSFTEALLRRYITEIAVFAVSLVIGRWAFSLNLHIILSKIRVSVVYN